MSALTRDPEYTDPFSTPGRWFRGNTHTHSAVSDGRLSIAERFAAYREAGYDFLALTDHRCVSDVSPFSDRDFLAISGSELHPRNPFGGELYHLVALDVRETIESRGRDANDVIADVRAQGGHVIIAHPYWCGHSVVDLMPLEGCFAVEVYNDTCARIGKANSEPHWDDLLDRGRPLLGIACDDAHYPDIDCFHGWVMVKAPDLTRESVLGALLTGSYYSTMGPAIHDVQIVDAEGSASGGEALPARKVVVCSSPARAIACKAQRSLGRRHLAPEGQLLEEAEFPLSGAEKYVRVEIEDERGRKAWSNPIFFGDRWSAISPR
ncbi:MAG: CehA/McbA family metallohydrolase [Armatimonadetes bacterium]|nr:CehA/McbA family metallohydrolase [Armatimonadota bacterium]